MFPQQGVAAALVIGYMMQQAAAQVEAAQQQSMLVSKGCNLGACFHSKVWH
jgi:hypothetical protein